MADVRGRGLDLVEVMTDGEEITASCVLCKKPFATWSEYALLSQVVSAWRKHARRVHRAPGTR